ncbi:MAG: transposase [Patescibacteria group bacterium]|nr:transposase [Patescibacteria group bacterium]
MSGTCQARVRHVPDTQPKNMGRPLREFYKGGFWHIVNRAVTGEKIFRKSEDYAFCLYKAKEILKKYPVTFHGYNFLSNHNHYLIKQTSASILPSKFLAIYHKSISDYINRKYSRTGHLFQDRPKIKPVKDDDYLLNISFYINLNKILEKLQRFDRSVVVSRIDLDKLLREAEKDPWSSYPVYLGLREDGITETKFILSLLSDNLKKARQEYRKLAKEFIISGHFLKTRDLTFEEGE